MPDLHVVGTDGKIGERKCAPLIADRVVRRIGDDDGGAHPGMEHVAVDADHAGPIEPFDHLAPFRQTDIEQCFPTQAGVHGVQDGVAVLEQNFAADRRDLKMWNKGAVLVIQNQRLGLSREFSIERVKNNYSILQAALGADQQSFIAHGRTAKRAALENRQRLGLLPAADNTNSSTNRRSSGRVSASLDKRARLSGAATAGVTADANAKLKPMSKIFAAGIGPYRETGAILASPGLLSPALFSVNSRPMRRENASALTAYSSARFLPSLASGIR
jgi:hypothetical protein